ncbi:MAG: hypothetical protein QNJ45_14810 [Ardenticatenaceae bacterium]|nr:hypothetical protein [Ardenticatenaceae bacterium]
MDNLAGSQQQPQNNPPPAASPSSRRLFLRMLGYVFLGLAFLLLFYGAVAYFAWQTGEEDRVAALEENKRETIDRQIELATEDIQNGNFQLALRRLDYVLATEPDNEAALRLSDEADTQLVLLLTPTLTPTALPTADSTPTTTPEPSNQQTRLEFEALEDLIDDQSWLEAVESLESFRQTYPDYRRRDVDEMLYDAYINYGLTLTRSVEIERGVYYLNLAAELGDLSEEVLGEIFWAEQYLEGIVFFGIDWEAYLSYFRPMCEFAPLYQDSCGKLAEGLLAYAEQYSAVQDWCPAEALIREALTTGEVAYNDVESQLTAATEFCLAATPTPEVDLTAAPPLDGSGVITNTFENNSFIPPVGTIEPEP